MRQKIGTEGQRERESNKPGERGRQREVMEEGVTGAAARTRVRWSVVWGGRARLGRAGQHKSES